MLPFSNPVMRGKDSLTYDTAIAAISGKTLYIRADTSTAADGSQTNSAPVTNEGSAGGTISTSTITIRTNVQNGLRGLLHNLTANVAAFTPAKTLADFFPSGRAFTTILVEKRTGLQSGGYSGDHVFGSDYFSICFSSGTRQRQVYSYDTGLVYNNVGAAYSDGVCEIIAISSDSSGNFRVNKNGVITTGTGITVPSYRLLSWDFSKSTNSNTYICEQIFTPNFISNAAVDDAVAMLRIKWGI